MYRHRTSGNYVLAETDGRVTREISTLPGWPRLSNEFVRQLCMQLRPLPGLHRARLRMVKKACDAQHERSRNSGRFMREMMANVRLKSKGTKKDNPAINWPKIKGEGV